MKKNLIKILIISAIIIFLPANFSNATTISNKLKGKILLQVESNGEAWYINPDNEKRYYLGRPEDAFQVMRNLGLGISNKDFDSFNKKFIGRLSYGIAPSRLSGKILLKVEDGGKAYYVNPTDLQIYYLGKPEDAFQVMRKLGLGITNNDLNKILDNNQTDASNLKLLNNTEIIEKLKDSVVYIETKDGAGSGFIVESNGYILTNAHVVQGVSDVSVILSNNTTLNASVIGRDENIDLALLKVDKTGLKNVLLGDSDAVKQGNEIFTLGYPFGIKGDVSIKEGIISRKLTNSGQEYLEISAEIHPGNSGGPLVNRYGQVVGINSAGLGQGVNGTIVGETIKLAIPINKAKNILNDLKNGRNIVNTKKVDEPIAKTPEPIKCSGNISDLLFVDASFKLYRLFGDDLDIYPQSNEMNLVGIIKNNNLNCIATNIRLRILIKNASNPSLNQEENMILKINDNFYSDSDPNLVIYPQKNGEYKTKIIVHESLIEANYTGNYMENKMLKNGVQASSSIVSVDWSPIQ